MIKIYYNPTSVSDMLAIDEEVKDLVEGMAKGREDFQRIAKIISDAYTNDPKNPLDLPADDPNLIALNKAMPSLKNDTGKIIYFSESYLVSYEDFHSKRQAANERRRRRT